VAANYARATATATTITTTVIAGIAQLELGNCKLPLSGQPLFSNTIRLSLLHHPILERQGFAMVPPFPLIVGNEAAMTQ
jgi:hypothetical protein